jgi:glucan phosphoethanolaminetransferase (alkaline phosphatase superfamily)
MNPLFLWEELVYHYELFDFRGISKGTIYLGTYALAIVSLTIMLLQRSVFLFYFYIFFIFVALSIDFFIQFLGVSHGFSLDEYILAVNELGNYKYLVAYLDTILKAMALSFMVSLLLYFIRKRTYALRIKSFSLIFVFLSLIIIYVGCNKIDTYKLSSYPAPLKIPMISFKYLDITEPIKDRILDENIKPKIKSKIQNIVWIIDESVTGSYLSLNGYPKETTPYLDDLSQSNSMIMSNFGVVNSISNCSGKSNLFLRIGMNPLKHTDISNQMYDLPTIFQYAKRAGYQTWLFDSQTRKDHLQNYLTLYDKEDIDNFRTLGAKVERVERDNVFVEALTDIINDEKSIKKNFIVLVKYGSHFPYLLTYDKKNTIFKPVMEVSYGGMDFEHKEQQVNTYLNSIYSSVDLYLKKLLGKIDLSKSVVFYTSDHGQNILEHDDLTRPHCNNEDVVKNEVSVPLMIFNENARMEFPVNKMLYYSQIQIFSTTLSLLGYDKDLIAKYGKTLSTGFLKSEERAYILSGSKEKVIYE